MQPGRARLAPADPRSCATARVGLQYIGGAGSSSFYLKSTFKVVHPSEAGIQAPGLPPDAYAHRDCKLMVSAAAGGGSGGAALPGVCLLGAPAATQPLLPQSTSSAPHLCPSTQQHTQVSEFRRGRGSRFALAKLQEELQEGLAEAGDSDVVFLSGPVALDDGQWGGPGGKRLRRCSGCNVPCSCCLPNTPTHHRTRPCPTHASRYLEVQKGAGAGPRRGGRRVCSSGAGRQRPHAGGSPRQGWHATRAHEPAGGQGAGAGAGGRGWRGRAGAECRAVCMMEVAAPAAHPANSAWA